MKPAQKKKLKATQKAPAKNPVTKQTVQIARTPRKPRLEIKLDSPDPKFFTVHICGQT